MRSGIACGVRSGDMGKLETCAGVTPTSGSGMLTVSDVVGDIVMGGGMSAGLGEANKGGVKTRGLVRGRGGGRATVMGAGSA
jgi:hypothetical protein